MSNTNPSTGTDDELGYPRSWKWDTDGPDLDGLFVRIDAVPTTDYAGEPQTSVLIEFNLVATREPVTLWLNEAKLKGLIKRELEARSTPEFEPDEHIVIRRLGKRISKRNGKPMWDFSATFEHAAPRPGVLEALGFDDESGEPATTDDGIPF